MDESSNFYIKLKRPCSVFFPHWSPLAHSSNAENRINGLTVVPTSLWNGIYNGLCGCLLLVKAVCYFNGLDWKEKCDRLFWSFRSHWLLFSALFTVIRAKVVGKKLLRDGPFGTMRYTVKQMKVRESSVCWGSAEQRHGIFFCFQRRKQRKHFFLS